MLLAQTVERNEDYETLEGMAYVRNQNQHQTSDNNLLNMIRV